MLIRELKSDEAGLLKDFLYEAIFVPEGENPPARDIIYKSELRIYYEDFGSGKADHCLVAEVEGKPAGAVWIRIMNDYGHVDDETPSLSIALFPEYRHKGIGTQLLKEILQYMRQQGYKKVSLSVQKANYAVSMYRKAGFSVFQDKGAEYIMVCRLG